MGTRRTRREPADPAGLHASGMGLAGCGLGQKPLCPLLKFAAASGSASECHHLSGQLRDADSTSKMRLRERQLLPHRPGRDIPVGRWQQAASSHAIRPSSRPPQTQGP